MLVFASPSWPIKPDNQQLAESFLRKVNYLSRHDQCSFALNVIADLPVTSQAQSPHSTALPISTSLRNRFRYDSSNSSLCCCIAASLRLPAVQIKLNRRRHRRTGFGLPACPLCLMMRQRYADPCHVDLFLFHVPILKTVASPALPEETGAACKAAPGWRHMDYDIFSAFPP